MADAVPVPARPSIDSEGGLAIAIPAGLDPQSNLAPIWTSTKPDTTEGKAALLTALSGQLPKLSTALNTTLRVKDVILQGVQLTNSETGEVTPAVRSILVMQDGTMLASVSEGIRASLGMIFQLWGQPPWKPPLTLVPKQIETSNNRRYFTLQYATGGK